MTRDPVNIPSARTWRDIPQPVVPRAMSREGRWRFAMAALRIIGLSLVAGVCAWGMWLVVVSIRENTRAMPAVAKGQPMKAPELRTDGVLDDAWLARTLALPKNVSLMEIDLGKLRARLLEDEQVLAATLTRNFPDRLVVQLSERSPVARVMTQWMGQQKMLLVARDGVIYAGSGYDPALLETLPWLDGVTIAPAGGHFRPIDGMSVTSELLARARMEAEHLYRNWNVVSLGKLASDQRLEVRTRDGSYVAYFSTRDDFFPQLVKLSYMADQLQKLGLSAKYIDLTLGQEVPIMVNPPAPDSATPNQVVPAPAKQMAAVGRTSAPRWADGPAAASTPKSEQALFVFPHSQTKQTKREL